MMNKTKIALSALIVVGFASAALAGGVTKYERDLWLQPKVQQSAGALTFTSSTAVPPVIITEGYAVGDTWIEPTIQYTGGASAFASAEIQHQVAPFTAVERATFERSSAAGFN